MSITTRDGEQLVDQLTDVARENGWRRRRMSIGETEGGAPTVTVVFVPSTDADQVPLPLGEARNGHREEAPGQDSLPFAEPRTHRPGAEQEGG